jgi:hypothetical protein
MLLTTLGCARRQAARVVDAVRWNMPAARARRRRIADLRARADEVIAQLGREPGPSPRPVVRRVLIDGMWDNPNYWLRLAMTRKALGLGEATEVGLLGRFARDEVGASFKRMGINATKDFRSLSIMRSRHRAEARRLLTPVRDAAELMRLRLPEGFPAEMFYDVVLKRQRRGVADLDDPMLADHLADLLASLEGAVALFDGDHFDLVLMTHSLSFDFGGIAWAAMKRRIPVLTLYGDFGTTRFIRIEREADFFVFPSRPTLTEVETMSPELRAQLTALGRRQLEIRRGGLSNDSGSQYAYKRRQALVNRDEIVRRFGWDPALPIIGIYAANWFDFPHCTGMWHFRDFVDWAENTVATAATNAGANWLCKAHPIDDRYGGNNGITLADIVARYDNGRVRLADTSWNSDQLLQAIDGVVTHHGLSGIEAASLGKAVLITDDAWYADLGLIERPNSRAAYLQRLASPWWRDWDWESARSRANLLAGWYFCAPDWHGNFVFADDSDQHAIYGWLPEFIHRNRDAIEREVCEISAWFASGHRFYHMFKMARASGFQLGNFPVER